MITVEQLEKRYPDGTLAVAGVDLHIQQGESVVLLGANGSGKSTLLRCMTRLIEPTAGRVLIGGSEVGTLDEEGLRALRRRVGVVFQHINLVDHISVLRNVVQGNHHCGQVLEPDGFIGADIAGENICIQFNR